MSWIKDSNTGYLIYQQGDYTVYEWDGLFYCHCSDKILTFDDRQSAIEYIKRLDK